MTRHLVLVLLVLSLGAALAAATPPRIASTEPDHDPATVTLERLWSRGGEDDQEVLFGHPRDVVADEDGRVLVLDAQLCQIVVFDRQGELVGILGREGEGPGEFRRPAGLITLPDGSVAAGSTFGARFEKLGLDGVPRGSLRLGDDGPQEGALVLYRADCRGGTLVAATATSAFDQATGKMDRIQQLTVHHPDGRQRAILREEAIELDFTGTRPVVEKTLLRDFLVVSAIGPDGLVHVPHGRDQYLIDVFDPQGNLVQQVSRPDFEAPPRTDRQHRRLEALRDTWERNAGIEIRFETSDTERAIQSMFVDERGHLFVRHAASNRDLPEGAFLRLDEFAPDGEWLREVLVMGVGDPELDTLVWLDSGRVAIQRGGALIALERWSDAAVFWEDEAEVVPELVVCAWKP